MRNLSRGGERGTANTRKFVTDVLKHTRYNIIIAPPSDGIPTEKREKSDLLLFYGYFLKIKTLNTFMLL